MSVMEALGLSNSGVSLFGSDGIHYGDSREGRGAMQGSPFVGSVLAGRRALVTGGGSGIGLQIALQLGLHGARVAIMGRSKEKLDKAVIFLRSEGVNALAFQGDVRHGPSAVAVLDAVVREMGGLDILVNNAAGNFLCLLEDLSLNAFKTVVDIDLVGTFNMSKASLEALKASGNGVIINITATLQ